MTETNKNPNHPEKGRAIRVDPIRRPEDIAAIKQILSGRPRDLLLFTMGINNGLRVGDLLRLKVKDLKSLKPGEFVTIKENKTGKQNILFLLPSRLPSLRKAFATSGSRFLLPLLLPFLLPLLVSVSSCRFAAANTLVI
jgi:integrase